LGTAPSAEDPPGPGTPIGDGDAVGDGDTVVVEPPVPPVDIDDIEDADPETLPDGVSAQSRVPRLSYSEYDKTVSDLLLTSVTPSQLFPAEQPNLGSYDDGGARGVSERLLQEIVLAAEQLAAEAVADPVRYRSLVGCEPTEAGCRDAFVQSFGRRAYRRPLTEVEASRFVVLFDQGVELIASGDAFRDGVELVLDATLQSAKFLYRAEQGDGEQDDAGTLLTDYEIATRLSYLFLGTTPDEELLAAAASGGLSTAPGIVEQATRLANDERVRDRVIDFHDRWFQMEGLRAAAKDPAIFPEFSPGLVGSMEAEMHAVVEEITLNRAGGIAELLTTPLGAVDASLASLYGLSGTYGESPTLVDFPFGSGRSGLLTQAAFLTGHSSASTRTSPILRGVFVLNRLLCQDVPPPPPGAEMQEPDTPPASELLTTRDYFAWKTSMDACAHCHNQINPVGFAFEDFDAIGGHRTTENGVSVDASGAITISGATLAYENGAEFSERLAELSRVRSCYAVNWLNYAFGREESAADSRTLARITAGLAESPFGARELLVALTTGAAFNHLPPL
jgi:hypothetical protein